MNSSKPPRKEDDLDFTQPGTAPLPTPTPKQVESARSEAKIGGSQLEASGYYVSIARHSMVRVPPKNGLTYVLLIVEDDESLGQLLLDTFTLAGFEVRRASNRAEINAELGRTPGADLVLLDIVLPDANGLLVLKRIREHPRLANLPVIMMTGKSAPEDVEAGLAAGADGYVSKPFQMSGLVKAVNSVLGKA